MGLKKIKLALNKIYDTELKIKSNSNIRNDLLVKNLIVDLCNTANDVSINQKRVETDLYFRTIL